MLGTWGNMMNILMAQPGYRLNLNQEQPLSWELQLFRPEEVIKACHFPRYCHGHNFQDQHVLPMSYRHLKLFSNNSVYILCSNTTYRYLIHLVNRFDFLNLIYFSSIIKPSSYSLFGLYVLKFLYYQYIIH